MSELPTPDRIPEQRHFDAIVVGSGSGGLTAAVGLSRFGRQVLMVERHQMGGDCTNVGCIPSKSLLHHSATGEPDANAVLATVRKRRNSLREHEVEEYGGAEGMTFVYGHATVVAEGRVEITSRSGERWQASAEDIVLSTGSSPRRIKIAGLPPERTLTNEELFELPEPPRHLAIVGGGPIGLEMAVAFRRLGSSVTVVEAADRVLPHLLPVASDTVAETLVGQGIDLRLGCFADQFDADTNRFHLTPAAGGEPADDGPAVVDDVDLVLLAVGRVPNTQGIGLQELEVAVDKGGRVVIDGRGRTSVDHLWAVGDMTTAGGTTHLASAWGRRVVQSIAYSYLPVGDEPLHPTVTFTNPEVASIGQQLPEPQADVVRITVDGSKIDRAYTDEVVDSLLIVDVRRFSGAIVGATIVGPRAGEIITTFSLAMKTGLAFHRWYGTVIPYPTYGEIITNAIDLYITETAPKLPSQFGSWLTGRVRRMLKRT